MQDVLKFLEGRKENRSWYRASRVAVNVCSINCSLFTMCNFKLPYTGNLFFLIIMVLIFLGCNLEMFRFWTTRLVHKCSNCWGMHYRRRIWNLHDVYWKCDQCCAKMLKTTRETTTTTRNWKTFEQSK